MFKSSSSRTERTAIIRWSSTFLSEIDVYDSGLMKIQMVIRKNRQLVSHLHLYGIPSVFYFIADVLLYSSLLLALPQR